MFYTKQASSLYSQILDSAISSHSWRLGCSSRYYRREIRGNAYLYRDVSINGKIVSISLGNYDKALHEFLSAQVSSDSAGNISALTSMFNSDPTVSRLFSPIEKMIEVVASFGVFKRGAVLVGSNAMHFYANMLGYRFDNEAIETLDVDVSADGEDSNSISLLIDHPGDEPSLEEALLMKGFDKILGLNHKYPATSFALDQRGFTGRLDLLCPMRGATSSQPVYIKTLRSYAEPIRYIDYLTSNAQISVMNNGQGTLVWVPDPSRYALHKLVVSERRPVSQYTKSQKDRMQAYALLDFLLDYRPNDIESAWQAAELMGGKFIEQLLCGLEKMPDIQEKLMDALPVLFKNGSHH